MKIRSHVRDVGWQCAMNLEAAPSCGELGATIRSDPLNNRPFDGQDAGSLSPPILPAQHWYALQTRSRYEKVVDRLLCEKGFETFLPLTIKRSRVTLRRFREAHIPLFPGYTFARLPASSEKFREIRATTGVAGLIGGRAGPVFIPDTEIESIKTLVAEKVSCRLSSSFAAGQRVMVTCGPLKGVRGEILRRKNRQLFVVRIRLIQRELEVDLSPRDLEAVALITESNNFLGDWFP